MIVKAVGLKNKLIIVDWFLELLNANQLHKIAEYVSDDFEFTSLIRGTIGFSEYCKYVTYNSDSFEVNIRERAVDGDNVIVHLDITIIDNSIKYHSKLTAIASFEFDDLLLKRLSIKYSATDTDMEYMKKQVAIQYSSDD